MFVLVDHNTASTFHTIEEIEKKPPAPTPATSPYTKRSTPHHPLYPLSSPREPPIACLAKYPAVASLILSFR